jgi:hypothetical protein
MNTPFRLKSARVKLFQERLRLGWRICVLVKVSHNVSLLFPLVECFVVFLFSSQQQAVDDSQIRNISVLFKFLAHSASDLARRDVQRVDFHDIRGLPDVSVKSTVRNSLLEESLCIA